MAIQWFPGHMHLTRKAIEERIKEIDVVIELLDARLPGSSANPMLAQLTAGKPALKVLNKQDLADPDQTAAWLAHYQALPGTRAIGLLLGERLTWPLLLGGGLIILGVAIAQFGPLIRNRGGFISKRHLSGPARAAMETQ